MEARLIFVLSKIQVPGHYRQLFYHRATWTYIIEIPIIKLWNKSDWKWSSKNPLNSLYLTSASQLSHYLSTNKALLFSMQPHPHTCNCYPAPTGLIKYLEFRLCKSCLYLQMPDLRIHDVQANKSIWIFVYQMYLYASISFKN